jgi:ABC-type nitrate/sulfonate/bicarbonate transport system substrate-binding protein
MEPLIMRNTIFGGREVTVHSRQNAMRFISCAATAALAATALAGCGSGASADGQSAPILGSYSRGFSVVLGEQLLANRGDKAAVQVKNYSDVSQLYTDFLSGQADMAVGGSDIFASQAEKGAPIHIAATISPDSTAIVGEHPIRSASDIKGKRIAAITSTDGWHLAEAVIQKEFGLEAGKDYQVIGIPDTASGVAQVISGTADYVVGWEPSVHQALKSSKKLMVSYSVSHAKPGETYGSGWQLVLGVRNDVPKSTEHQVIEGLEQAAEELNASPAKADALGVKFGFEKGTAEGVMNQSVKPFVVQPISAEVRGELQKQLALVQTRSDRSKLPADFYGG